MFCQRKDDDESTLSCSTKLLSEIISFLSIIFSGMIIYVTAKYTKLNIVNHLILQILISEIIDGINILLVIFEDIQWPFNYENFFNRRGICFILHSFFPFLFLFGFGLGKQHIKPIK